MRGDPDPKASAQVLAARTALLLPFHRPEWSRRSPEEVAAEFRERRAIVPIRKGTATREISPLWVDDDLFIEVEALAPEFRALLGREARSPLSWRVLQLNRDVTRKSVLGKARIRTKHLQEVDAPLSDVRVICFSQGYGALWLTIDWVEKDAPAPDLDGLLRRLNALRHLGPDESHAARWTFEPDPRPPDDVNVPAWEESLGPDLVAASRSISSPIATRGLAAWLVCGRPPKDGDDSDLFLRSRYALPQTAVMLGERPESPESDLFHLARAYKPEYRAPDREAPGLLRMRANRIVEVTREGAASLSWAEGEEGSDEKFEIEQWPDKFVGLYVLITLQALGERLVLSALSTRASELAPEIPDSGSLVELRPRMDALLRDMARHTLMLPGDDSGGLSDYADFHLAVRRAQRATEQREELRREMSELSILVRDSYLQEQAGISAEEQRSERRFHRRVAAVTVGTLPLALAFGFLGTNLDPGTFSPSTFWRIVGLAIAASGVGLLLMRTRAVRDRRDSR